MICTMPKCDLSKVTSISDILFKINNKVHYDFDTKPKRWKMQHRKTEEKGKGRTGLDLEEARWR